MSLLNRKRTLLAKIESTPGTDPTPTGAANAILVRNLTLTPMETTLVSRDLIRPYLGNSAQLPAANYAKLAFEVELAGSGTAATAPAWGPLLRGCGLAETTLAAAVTGTATSGSATNTITLTATSATDDFYIGQPLTITGGASSGDVRVITDYVGSTKVATVDKNWTTTTDNTSTYSIGASVVYRPISSAFESLTFYFGVDGVKHKMTYGRGTVSLSLPLWGIPVMKFAFTGVYTTPTDTADPTVTLTAWTQPLTVNAVNTPAVTIHGYGSAAVADLSFDFANAVTYRSLVGGSESVVLTDRQCAGSATIEATTVAAKAWWTAAANATTGALAVRHGTAAGNKIYVSAPAVQVTKPNYSEKDQITMLQMGLVIQPTAGNDELFICSF
jgi:hypothetical protein